MKIIEPKVELWKQGDDAKAHVARCASYLNPYYRSAYNVSKRRK